MAQQLYDMSPFIKKGYTPKFRQPWMPGEKSGELHLADTSKWVPGGGADPLGGLLNRYGGYQPGFSKNWRLQWNDRMKGTELSKNWPGQEYFDGGPLTYQQRISPNTTDSDALTTSLGANAMMTGGAGRLVENAGTNLIQNSGNTTVTDISSTIIQSAPNVTRNSEPSYQYNQRSLNPQP